MPRRLAYLLLASISSICLLPSVAWAACSSPSGVEGEIFYNTDFKVMAFCDGTNWVGMAGGGASGGGSGVTDGDKGDVTVSGSGATWTVDSSAITYAKIQNVSVAGTILGRATTGAGVVEEITLGSGLTLTGTTLSATGSSSGTAGYIQFSGGSGAFASSSTTAGQQFFWDETNHRLGIGLAVPTQALDVVGKMTSNSLIVKPLTGLAAPTGGSGTWTTNGTNVWRATGNVGIGTASPTYPLHVVGQAGTVGAAFYNPSLADGGVHAIRIGKASNANEALGIEYKQDATASTVSMHFFGDTFGSSLVLKKGGNVGIGTASPSGALHVVGDMYLQNAHPNIILSDGVPSTAANLRYLIRTSPDAGNVGDFEIITLNRSTGSEAHRTRYVFNGDWYFPNNAYKPGGGSWAASSDERLKDIDGTYEQGLASVVRLKPVRFHYKKDNPRHEPSDKQYVGLVAQDVQRSFPEAVSKGSDGFLSLDTTPISFAVINAIKELKADNDNLRAEFEAQGREIEALKAAR